MRQIFLDTETTGLRVEDGNRVIEIGCVEMIDRKLTGHNLHFYLNPERESEPDALRIHGLTTDFLSDKPLFEAVADAFLNYIEGAELIIHNAPFDCGFLNHELALIKRVGLEPHAGSIVDSLKMAKELYPGKRNSLDALCLRFEIDNTERSFHGALLDAKLLSDVYINMTRGQKNLLDDDALLGYGIEQNKEKKMDLSGFITPVIKASSAENEAHEAVLLEIDKASKGKTLWRKIP